MSFPYITEYPLQIISNYMAKISFFLNLHQFQRSQIQVIPPTSCFARNIRWPASRNAFMSLICISAIRSTKISASNIILWKSGWKNISDSSRSLKFTFLSTSIASSLRCNSARIVSGWFFVLPGPVDNLWTRHKTLQEQRHWTGLYPWDHLFHICQEQRGIDQYLQKAVPESFFALFANPLIALEL